MIFWGTFFPLISEAITGERSSLGSPWFDRYTAPLAIVLVLFTGIGPLLAWRKVSAGALWRLVRVAARRRRGRDGRGRGAHRRRSSSRWRWCCSPSPSSRSRRWRAEFWRGAAAQRALGGRLAGRRRSARVVARNRRRYGGYIVHAGIAILFIAVAASSSFQTSARPAPAAGRVGEVGDYTVTYVEPDARRSTPTSSGSPSAPCSTSSATASSSRRCTRRATTTRPASADAATAARLLRGRGDERGRAPRGGSAATCGRRCAPTWRRSTR